MPKPSKSMNTVRKIDQQRGFARCVGHEQDRPSSRAVPEQSDVGIGSEPHHSNNAGRPRSGELRNCCDRAAECDPLAESCDGHSMI